MKIDVLTLFPRMFEGPMGESIIGKAVEKNLLEINISNFRDYSDNKHQSVDDYPYGGGAGMLLKVQPIYDNLRRIEEVSPETEKRVILLDPAGKRFNQKMAEEFSEEEHLVFICGHYEGYDERIRSLVTDEVSLGDYVLTGGELGAMVMIDATVRLLPDVLGNKLSAQTDSHSTGLLEHPQYTRPAEFNGMNVPEVLTNGNHKLIDEWQQKESLRRTFERRPDMLKKVELTGQQLKWLEEIYNEKV
ncbi:tRNA (guanosine(37)-N1)-methyltransferase TrmD [Enterococcus ureilyticus]|uniref:tRNA (guanine-N(1)-)-methyltransferase n=1 Tax=Enterococcus ureilyticus TaxID=1131292 RepID=A0A1E5HDB3_9ENTE|nr:tRNA (guanosine(37)-N1)-methyltransferase TrmD [Enterococcus ureilyticus]MBM7690136.1 tRNA (guanine37-N1)-methyltransferase [Enterococcus ureilyticus]MBO0447263.1 tRNA (guanosine(37)-N1)-methyltransferase TrmD [Enterococcus ureilyticus]OEG22933.1 tRNA (guanosine(37)-N1)-methyltransferase TrmD [Enterococcus ureilyticus]